VKHDVKVPGVLNRKAHVSLAERPEPFGGSRLTGTFERPTHRVPETCKSVERDRPKQLALVGEVVVRSRRAHASVSGDLTQAEILDAPTDEKVDARVEELPPQIAVVIRALLLGHTSYVSRWILTLLRFGTKHCSHRARNAHQEA